MVTIHACVQPVSMDQAPQPWSPLEAQYSHRRKLNARNHAAVEFGVCVAASLNAAQELREFVLGLAVVVVAGCGSRFVKPEERVVRRVEQVHRGVAVLLNQRRSFVPNEAFDPGGG